MSDLGQHQNYDNPPPRHQCNYGGGGDGVGGDVGGDVDGDLDLVVRSPVSCDEECLPLPRRGESGV